MTYFFSVVFLLVITAITLLRFIPVEKLTRMFLIFWSIVTLMMPLCLPAAASPNQASSILESSNQIPNQATFKFEENVCVSPTGDEFSGLCIAQDNTKAQSETDLLEAVSASIAKERDINAKVDNGAVLLSGSISNEEKAYTLIHEIESIPGIQWITVELALANTVQNIAQ